MISCARMTISLTILPGPRGVDINAICGGRGRCTSCRVKLVAGTAPPPTIMDELQLGDALVREGYRLSCQWPVTEPVTVQIAPPLDDTTFQILGGERPAGAPQPVSIDAGIRKRAVTVVLPKDEHQQTSDVEALVAAAGGTVEDVPAALLKGLPATLRDRDGLVTVT